MSLGDLQRMTARLTTEAPLLSRFLKDPEGTAVAEGWSVALAQELHATSASGMRRYGESLTRKRTGEAARCLPLSRKALGAELFRELFRKHAERTTTEGTNRHALDAIAFAECVSRTRANFPEIPDWIAELLQVEAAALRAWATGKRLILLPIGRHPLDLADAVESQLPPSRRPCLVVWFRIGDRRPRRLVFGFRQKSRMPISANARSSGNSDTR